MNPLAEFKTGIWKHYTGGLYVVTGLVRHHHTGNPMVEYISLETGNKNVRPLRGWPEDPDGFLDLVEEGVFAKARFTFVSEPKDFDFNLELPRPV